MEVFNPDESAKFSRIWSPQHPPPPLKPLPNIPSLQYPFFLHAHSSDSLLSHSIPSPSITFDDAMMNSYCKWSTYSTNNSDVESSSARTSLDTIVEYAHSLLPPAPLSQKPATSANLVDCRLQQKPSNEPGVFHTLSLSHQCPVPETVHLGEYKSDQQVKARSLNRRSSSIFPRSDDSGTVTPASSLDLSRSSTATIVEVDDPMTPPSQSILQSQQLIKPTQERSAPRIRLYHEPVLHNISPPMPNFQYDILEGQEEEIFHPSRPAPSIPNLVEGQESFMHWDDEMDDKYPRVAKVKKSLVDLRNPGRLRSNSVPIQPTVNTAKVHNASIVTDQFPTTGDDPSKIYSLHNQPNQVDLEDKPSQPLSWLGRKKSRHLRRVTIGYENVLNKTPSVGATPLSPLRQDTVAGAIVDVPEPASRRRGFTRLARWMKKLMKSS